MDNCDYMFQFMELINQPVEAIIFLRSFPSISFLHPLSFLRHSLRASRCAPERFYDLRVLVRQCFI